MNRIGKIYDLSIEVRVTDKVQLQEGQGKESGEDGYDGEDVGLDKHLSVHTSPLEIIESQQRNDNNSNKNGKNNKNVTI